MRRFLRILAMIIAAMTVTTAYAVDGAKTFQRGIGVHRPLNWASVSPLDSSLYTWPPFATAEHYVPDELITAVQASGFDFVRLTVDPGPFLQMTGERRDALDTILRATIQRFRAQRLSVIVNFHSNSQVAQYRPEAIFVGAERPLFTAYAAVVSRTARLLANMNDPNVALEPVNEPPAGYDTATAGRWQTMMEALYRAARQEAPRLTLVVTGAQGGSWRGLGLLDPAPFRDENVIYSFHYYEPHLFTHQGVESSEPRERFWRDMQALPYPAIKGEESSAIRAVQDRIAADPAFSAADKARQSIAAKAAIATYFSEGWDAKVIDAAFDSVAAWATRNNIDTRRILLGEFGATRNSTAGDQARATWLLDVRCAAERRTFRWSIWELNGSGGMAIVDRANESRLDRTTLDALGLLKPGCPS
ncbi:glycoside hydrolase family 5 protein [Afipia sp. DC4300-2b1]|uniref:glycoside hydrolase family 5 protein n=1 Tax=Afipia sp. DC4300-2b1 TaxID=2804672 RepID=UPI003CF106B7